MLESERLATAPTPDLGCPPQSRDGEFAHL